MKEYNKSSFYKLVMYLIANIATACASIVFVIIVVLVEEGIYESSIYDLGIKSFNLNQYFSDEYPYFMGYIIYDLIKLKYYLFLILIVFAGIAVFCMVRNVMFAGYRKGEDGIVKTWFDKIPIEIVLAALAAIEGITLLIGGDEASITTVAGWAVLILVMVITVNMIYFAVLNIAIRIKQKAYKSSIICVVVWGTIKLLKKLLKASKDFCKEVWGRISLLWRVIVSFALYLLLELFVIGLTWFETDNLVICWIIRSVILFPLVVYLALMLRKLQEAGEKLSEGDLSYKSDLNHLWWDFKKHGENLNKIGDGMEAALKERMKSEHMKTELITNVSHDIKTPLTSIINYATLISEEETENEKIKEYSEVLVRQSGKLKRLTEDIVEASKASTGNLEVELAPCDASIFITQASGEYEEKLATNNLTLVVKAPSEDISIMADGRRMWRVFDNLMNNICKYSLTGSRVYLSLESVGENAVFTFKNTSREELDISEEELMERFVRGDKSRNTEGNGLGLSIAKSLTELQKGNLKISIDGDLFKAMLTFPKI